MNAAQGLRLIEETRVIAVLRGIEPSRIVDVASALSWGGVKVAEVTLNSPGALSMIGALQDEHGDSMFIGAGTVLDVEDARQAVEAGASFLVSPNTDRAVVEYAVARDVPVIMGAITPSEIVTAWKAGASAVKVFPVATLGLAYIRELRGPFNDIPLVPFGGVTETNVAQYLAAGCHAVGVGSVLINLEEVEAARYDGIEERARRLMAAIKNQEGDK